MLTTNFDFALPFRVFRVLHYLLSSTELTAASIRQKGKYAARKPESEKKYKYLGRATAKELVEFFKAAPRPAKK